ncbi:MAG: class I tRNA ligase family protein [Planctomycetota bacterium]
MFSPTGSWLCAGQSGNASPRAAPPPEGCPTGGYALNPMTLRPMPIWVSGFVLPSIRFGAILGTPGHDSRHLAFARQFGLPTRAGSIPNKRGRRRRGRGGRGERRGGGPGSGSPADLRWRIRSTLEARHGLEAHVDYNLRDWIFARQRYWGEPIPMVHCDACGVVPVAEADLPVPTPLLDEIPMVDEGKSPLAKVESFVRSTCPSCGGEARRETDTMPQWIASCWYYLRYLDPDLRERLFDEEAGRKWLPVNLCVGGIEHAILHLLYVRFFSYFFHDLGITSREEPFRRLFNQGRIYRKSPSEQMRRVAVHRGDRIEAQPYLEKHGSDVLRLHLLFLGPPEADVVWNEGGMKGCARLLKRAHEVVLARKDQGRFVSRRALVEKHRLIRRVTRAIRTFRMNKAVSAFMEFVNELRGNRLSLEEVDRSTLRTFIILLAPFTPHLAAELWEHLGEPGSVFEQRWPEYSEELLKPLEVEIGIFVNARLCDRLKVEGEVSKSELLERVMGLEKVKMLVGEKRPDRVIVVPSRLVKLVYAAPVAVGMEPEPSPPVGSPRREEPGASG